MAEIVADSETKTRVPKARPKPKPRPRPRRYDYDIVIIGSGPAGHRAAIQSAKLGKRVAVIEKKSLIGGVSVNTGTIPSKTLREAVLAPFRLPAAFHIRRLLYRSKQHITMNDLLLRADHVIRHEIEINKHQLQRNGVAALRGHRHAWSTSTRFISTSWAKKGEDETHHAPYHYRGRHHGGQARAGHPLRRRNHLHQRRLAQAGDHLPRTLTVVGGGVIGCEYACMFATLGVRVTLVEVGRPFADLHRSRDRRRPGLSHAAAARHLAPGRECAQH